MAPPPDISGPLTAAALTAFFFQLAAGGPTMFDGSASSRLVNYVGPGAPAYITVGISTPYAPGSSHRAAHEHPPHAIGSRVVATTSTPAFDGVIVAPDSTEYTKDGASDKLIGDMKDLATKVFQFS